MQNEILKAFKYRIYPTEKQEIELAKTFGACRFVWNKFVASFNSYGMGPTQPTSEKYLKDIDDYSFLKEVSAASLQQARMNFDETKKQYFNKSRATVLGRPKFKSKSGKQSYRLPNQKFSIDATNNTIRLEKIGKVRIILDRLPVGDLRSVTISKTPSGKYFVSVLVKTNVNLLPTTGKQVGIDVGLKDLIIMSNGEVINNPKWFRENQSKLKRAQQHLSRKQKGSKRRELARIKVAKIHEAITNRRKHFIHQVTTDLVRKYDLLVVEDLSVKNMVRNRKLAKSISDASWSEFFRQLNYKCSWYGKTLIKIDRFYPSSKTCGSCGYKIPSLALDIREWECPCCKTPHDRDKNAASNILQKGISELSGEDLVFPKSAELVDYMRGGDVSLGFDQAGPGEAQIPSSDKHYKVNNYITS